MKLEIIHAQKNAIRPSIFYWIETKIFNLYHINNLNLL